MNGATEQAESVTVVIPTRNRWPWVAKAIDSALEQSHSPVQVIVVDDASTDGTAESVLSRYDGRIRLIQNPKNEEKSCARNTGIRAATTEFVCMLDSDDILLPDSLAQRLIPFKEDSAFNGVSYGAGLRSKKRLLLTKDRYPSGNILPLYLKNFRMLDNNACLLRRHVMLEYGMYHPGLTNMEDREMLIRLTSRLPFQFCGTVTHRVRRVDRSASEQHKKILNQGQALTTRIREDPDLTHQLGSGFRLIQYMEDRELARSIFKLRRYREYISKTQAMLKTYPDLMRTNKRYRRRLCVAHALKACRFSSKGHS